MLTGPLRDRFGIIERLEFYEAEDLQNIILRAAEILKTNIDADAALEVARRSRGTPRIANRLLKRVRDWAQVKGIACITVENIADTLVALGIDDLGLDDSDRRYLDALLVKFKGGPVGVETIAACIAEDSDTLEDVVEPYLLQCGFIDRTSRGRMATALAYKHVGLTPPEVTPQQAPLF